MHPETIRIIDKYLGKPLCFLLTLHRQFLDLCFAARQLKRPLRKVMFIKLVEQGATVLAYAALREACERYGRENVFFCVFENNRDILDVMDVIPGENVFAVRQANLLLFMIDILKMIKKARKIGVDAAIDMEFYSRASAVISYLLGATLRVGLHRFNSEAPYRGNLMTHRLHYNPYLHTAEAYLLSVKALEMAPEDVPLAKYPKDELMVSAPSFVAGEDDKSRLLSRLKNEGIFPVSGPVILLNPNAGDMLPLRKWPMSRFVQLAEMILEAYPSATLILTGTASERENVEAIGREPASSRVFNLAGKTTLKELLTLYTMADVLVTNDSGPGHFASMTDIHSIVLFGPETPRLFGAIGGRPHAISANLSCSPCVNVANHRFSPCKNNRCMEAITVDRVMSVIKACITENGENLRGVSTDVGE